MKKILSFKSKFGWITAEEINGKITGEIRIWKFLNTIYPGINDYIESNLRILKEDLDKQTVARTNNILKEIMANIRSEFFPLDESTVIMIGNSYDKIIKLLGEPIEIADRIRGDNLYLMTLYTINKKTYKFYFENNILFDFKEIIKWKNI